MFIGLVLSIVIIIGYAIYAGGKYATKAEAEELRRRLDELEKAPGEEQPPASAGAEAIEKGG